MSGRSRAPGRDQRRFGGGGSADQPIEYSMLLTAALCLLAFGVVMVFSASSTTSLLGESGDGAFYLKRTLIFGVAGLLVLRALSIRGLRAVRALTPVFVLVSLALLVIVLVPGTGPQANGAQRWIGAGLVQFQPSELAKLALIMYGAHLLASRPRMVRDIPSMAPYLLVVGGAAGLIVLEPDLGTAIVLAVSVSAMLVAAGARLRHLALLALGLVLVALIAIMIEPYRMERLSSFLSPGADTGGAGFQASQARIALGSGGLFGVGLGESVQKAFYLPEAHTDMISAVIGEELGLAGITVLVGLYALFAYAGFRTAQRARDRYGKLLAAGLTSLVMTQAMINLLAATGLAPLTGIPLPFVSYGNSSLLTMLAAVGLLLNVARDRGASAASRSERKEARATGTRSRAAKLRVVEGGRSASGRKDASGAKSRDSRGRNRRAHRAGSGGRRRAAG